MDTKQCRFCQHWDGTGGINDKKMCFYHNEEWRGCLFCPAYLMDKTKIPADENKAPTHSHVASVPRRRVRVSEPQLIFHDEGRPDLEPFGHQKEAIERYADKDEIALFFLYHIADCTGQV